MTGAVTVERIVLVVDDFPAVLAWASRAFERDGWSVLTASGGREALSLCRDQVDAGRPVTLLVTDLDLPEFDGVHLTKAMRALDPHVPVIALSANAAIAREWSGELLDRTVFFTKPVRASQLVAAANGLVARPPDPLDSLSPSGPG